MKKLLILTIILCSASALAGPARPIGSSNFTVQTPCGPAHDAFALQGQWFIDSTSGSTNVNIWEYHDDDDSGTIAGVVQNINYSTPGDPNSNILGFSILATVSNSLPADYQGGSASNSHSEVQTSAGVTSSPDQMEKVRITAEFALANINLLPNGNPPYWPDPLSAGQYYIVATNEDELAWYCWAPSQTQYQPTGAYQVPTWKLSPFNIPSGGTASVLMQFTVSGTGMPLSDYRHSVIRVSQQMGLDVLYNRHTSLKISHWIDTLLVDNGAITTPNPPWWEGEEEFYVYASDASVFYSGEEEVVSHKMHWPQLPDPNGWDVRACYGGDLPEGDGLQKILADDFLCTSNGPITKITFWGSFKNDFYNFEDEMFQGITNFHLSLHKDIPDPDGPDEEYSKPLIPAEWRWDLNPTNLPSGWEIAVIPEVPSSQGWYDPNKEYFELENHTEYFRYEVTIPADDAFVQTEGEIYWLDISVKTDAEFISWGWKTTTNHWNDDAVWADIPIDDASQWNELRDPIEQISLDLAFVIDGETPSVELDFGDLPDSFNTLLANSGANHTVVQGICLGSAIDSEPDGQPTAAADGDDLNGATPDDEDGVVFLTPFVPGLIGGGTIQVTASISGTLEIWMDVDNSGNWNAGDNLSSRIIIPGPNIFPINIPSTTVPGPNVMRFRFNTLAPLGTPTGPAINGEVEDYLVTIEETDWGDARDAVVPTDYPTLDVNNGARHIIAGGTNLALRLGPSIDAETDGQPANQADGDDLFDGNDDEDGVFFPTPFIPGTWAQITVDVSVGGGTSGNAYLQGWIDYNADGDWTDPGEQILTDYSVAFTGMGNLYTLSIPIPSSASNGTTFARFRLSTYTGLGISGIALDGEVEDHKINILEAMDIDWGDAYDNWNTPVFPTLYLNNGASHVINSGLYLGSGIDADLDGQPAAFADGDDKNFVYSGISYPPGDEDGVTFTTQLQPGGYAGVDVTASLPGALDAWIDFNNDGDWADTGERIFTAKALSAGTNALVFGVPINSVTGITAVARFRYSSSGVASYTGLAMDGEVEDHLVDIEPIEQQGAQDWGDAPSPFPTLHASGGARHTIVPGIVLGATIDAEADGQPSATADGDDNNLVFSGIVNDEDGVTFATKFVAGASATIDVIAGVTPGTVLDAWVDFNGDGIWAHPGEHLFGGTPFPLAPGLNAGIATITVPSPPNLTLGASVARFRISVNAAGLPPSGLATNGEVEDYLVTLYQPQTSTNVVITNIIVSVSNFMATVEWNAENNIIYQVQSSTNLLTNIWTDVGGLLIGPINWQTNSATPTPQYYRITAPWTE